MLAEGSYPAGCEGCEIQHTLGNRMSTPAQSFDRYTVGDWPSQMEFTLSNRCNLECVQCNGDVSSTIRARREKRPPLPVPYGEEFFAQLPPYLEHVELTAFLGGEPFLIPEARRVWDLLLDGGLRPEIHVTTNATVWNDRVERYVNDLAMGFAVSIDGATRETYEAIRVGARYDRVIEIRDRMLEASRRNGSYFQLNFCLLRANWHELAEFCRQGDELDVPVNVIPVLQPASHSVLRLSADELADVVTTLDRQDAAIGRHLGRNRPAWENAVRMIREELERVRATGGRSAIEAEPPWGRASQETYVANPVRVLRSRQDPIVVRMEDELRAWSGRDLIEVQAGAGLVESVQAPPWAAALRAEEWVGRHLEAMTEMVADRLGPLELGDVVPVGEVETRQLVAHAPHGDVRVRVLWIWSLELLLFATPDPLEP
jgi:molybdenum cofactor biosynthesis enzyme MoaA